jgi:uncharacterized protein (DUF488 family)
LLQTYGIRRLVDIRTIPRSRHNPQFNDTALAGSLAAAPLEYVPCRALGGLRHPSGTSTEVAVGIQTDCVRKAPCHEAFRGLLPKACSITG